MPTPPVPVRFLADSSGEEMLELYNNSKVGVPDYANMDPLTLHIAFVCDDVAAMVDRLVAAGAILVSGPEEINGDGMAILRDPWGVATQLCDRRKPMI